MAFLINGNGFKPVTAQQDADLYGGIVGLPLTVLNIGEKMAAYVAANTDVHILDGEAVCQGRRIHINAGDYDSFAIPTGTVGVIAYYIIGYRLYTDADTGNEVAETFVRHMNNATETIPEDVLRDGAADCYVSMYRITLNGLSITATTPLYSVLKTAQELEAGQGEISANLSALIQSKVFIANYTYSNTAANTWQYTGRSFTVPSGYAAICYVLSNYASGACKGLGLSVSNTLPSAGAPEMLHDTSSTHLNRTCAFYLAAGTYYVFSKRASASASPNTYNVQGLQIKLM